jgi:RecB family exonuclease
VSSTYAYEACPRRYRFSYVDRVPEPRAEVPQHWRFGTVVHRGLEAGYLRHREVGFSNNLRHTIPTAIDAVRDSWAAELMPDDPRELGRAERVVAASLATTRLRGRDILGVERFFRSETPEGLRVAGAVDLVVRDGDGAIEIRDHKVTRYTRTPEALARDLQLGLYAWLARRTWSWVRSVSVAHHYPLLRTTVRTPLVPTAGEEAIERVRTTALVAEADHEFAPRPGKECAVCAYATLCPDAAVAAKNEGGVVSRASFPRP